MKFRTTVLLERKTETGLQVPDEVDVEIELDAEARDIAVPQDLAAALSPESRAFLDPLTTAQRNEWVR